MLTPLDEYNKIHGRGTWYLLLLAYLRRVTEGIPAVSNQLGK